MRNFPQRFARTRRTAPRCLLGPPADLLSLPLVPAGCCAGQELLPPGPVDAVAGGNVTLRTLVTDPAFAFITWSFNNGSEQIFVATLPKSAALNTNEQYKGRVSVDPRSGSLTLAGVQSADSGDYSISIITTDGTTATAEIKLRVLGEFGTMLSGKRTAPNRPARHFERIYLVFFFQPGGLVFS